MTIEELNKKLEKRIKNIEKISVPLKKAVISTMAGMNQRIFVMGKLSNMQKIGQGKYSDKELWVSDERLPRKGNHRGKPNAKGKTRKIKTTYYKNYTALKKAMGRYTNGVVNLRLTNDLQSDFNNAPVSNSGGVSAPKPLEINKLTFAILLRRNSLKKEGLEEKYGAIFLLTKVEKERFYKTFQKEWELVNAK